MGSGVFFKLAALVIAAGVTACALLALRQSRIQAGHEIARAQLRIRQLDEDLWRRRVDVASRVTPLQVHELSDQLGDLRGLVPRASQLPPGSRLAPEIPMITPLPTPPKPAQPKASQTKTSQPKSAQPASKPPTTSQSPSAQPTPSAHPTPAAPGATPPTARPPVSPTPR